MYKFIKNLWIKKHDTLSIRLLKTTNVTSAFWEKDEKGGYIDNRVLPGKVQMIKDGLKELKEEIALWSEEVKETLESDPYLIFRPGETDVMWKFESEGSLDQWVVTSDKDNNEGYSNCTLLLNKNAKGLFSGELNTRVPKDGRIKRAGYCNIRTIRARVPQSEFVFFKLIESLQKSFKRDAFLDWSNYNMLVMKVRGDGRSYMLNISTKGFFDLTWNDTYHYVLYTRGGPYWQLSKVKFKIIAKTMNF